MAACLAEFLTDHDTSPPMQPLAHSSSLRLFRAFMESLGLGTPQDLDADLVRALDQPAERVPARMIVDLMQACALAHGRLDLGAAFAAWADVAGYGPLSRMPDHCDTVAEVVEAGLRFMHLENGALASDIQEDEDEAVLRCLVMVDSRQGSSQFAESILMLSVRVVRRMLGDFWTPLRVEFAHAPPTDLKAHRRLFRCALRFNAERHAVVMAPRDLRRPSRVADQHGRKAIEAQLWAMDQAWSRGAGELAERAVAALLGSGEARLDRVAHSLGVEPRTLQRRLAAEGRCFAAVLDAVRRREALDYLRGAHRPALTELAQRLGYGDASAASRFLRSQLRRGVRPTRPPA